MIERRAAHRIGLATVLAAAVLTADPASDPIGPRLAGAAIAGVGVAVLVQQLVPVG